MQDAFSYCAELVRAADHDRFIAALFAPAEHRGGLHALHAFNSEVARVRTVAREPLAGEIRLQWWSDVINRERDDEAHANPVASALLTTIDRYRLASDKLLDFIEARRFDLYDEPMATVADLEAYAGRTSSALFALGGQILGGPAAESVSEPAGLAFAIAGLLRAFPRHAARGQLYVPAELLDHHQVHSHDLFAGRSSPGLKAAFAEFAQLGRRHLSVAGDRMPTLPPAATAALLPVALVRPALDRLQRGDPFSPAELAPWRRQWLMWRAARNPARIAG